MLLGLSHCFVFGAFGCTVKWEQGWQELFLLLIAVIPFAFIGDYFESHLKRNQQIKDSGSLIPGHGGIWDRLDSHMAIIPVFAALNRSYSE